MKRRLPLTLVLLCVTILSAFVLAENRSVAQKGPHVLTDFTLEIIRDGKACDENRLVHLGIWNLGKPHGYYVLWTEVYVQPLHDSKKVRLAATHFQSETDIERISVGPKTFSFRINLLEGHGLTADVVGKMKEGGMGYSVEASALVPVGFDGIFTGRRTTETWRSTDKEIVFPYKEICFP